MRKQEQAFLKECLEAIAEDVSNTPVHCGVKQRALEKLEALLAAVEKWKLKAPPTPKPRKKSKEEMKVIRELWKGLGSLTGKPWKQIYKEAQAIAKKTPGFPSKDKILVKG